ncbi:MAG: preprotein translocase subunit SecE [Clostridia bacterium]|nr:preprotein translocase subunit SecE [Clostridia bacterium]
MATKTDKVKKPSKIGKAIKETSSELKKVSWPGFKKVAKQTGVVLAVVFILGIVLFGIDRLLSWLYIMLIGLL